MNGSTSTSDGDERPPQGLLSRHPRLGILLIGALFIAPICAMVLVIAVLIIGRS